MNEGRADNGGIATSAVTAVHRARRRREGERGQALVEFALIAPLFVALVAGVIQFGVALNYWLDLQRLANQGARWAVVNCGPASATVCNPSLEAYLESQEISQGNSTDVTVCWVQKSGAGGTPTAGDPVTVKMVTQYQFVPIVKVGTISLRGSATMRAEQKPSQGGLNGAPTC